VHGQAGHVLCGVELLVLSADYAHLLLFKEQQHSWERTDLHERAGLRMAAFRQGYEGTFGGFAQEPRMLTVHSEQHRHPKRRAKSRLARSQRI
jgi:hypothetical protein